MQNEILVDEIMEEIYRRLESKVSQELARKKLIVIGPMPYSDLENLRGVYEFSSYSKGVVGYEGIVITKLTVDMLSHIALSAATTGEESFIIRALLQEKSVYMMEQGIEYRRYKKNAHKALYTLLMDYEDKINKYGIKCISHLDEISIEEVDRGNEKIQEVIRENVKLDMTYKKLLLESDLIKKHIEGICTVSISKRCIITPLAEDYIRTHHIHIEKV